MKTFSIVPMFAFLLSVGAAGCADSSGLPSAPPTSATVKSAPPSEATAPAGKKDIRPHADTP